MFLFGRDDEMTTRSIGMKGRVPEDKKISCFKTGGSKGKEG